MENTTRRVKAECEIIRGSCMNHARAQGSQTKCPTDSSLFLVFQQRWELPSYVAIIAFRRDSKAWELPNYVVIPKYMSTMNAKHMNELRGSLHIM